MDTEVQVVSTIKNGVETLVNKKGCETIKVDLFNNVGSFSINDRKLRLIGVGKKNATLYKMTLKSFKELKKYLISRGLDYRFTQLEKR